MTPHQYIGLAARLFAVWLALVGLGNFLSLLFLEGPLPDGIGPVRYAASLLYLAIALILWLFPLWVAEGLLPRTRFEDTLRVPSHQALAVAVIVLGLILVIFRALPELLSFLMVAVAFVASGQPISAVGAERAFEGVLGVVELIVGFAMIRNAPALAKWSLPADGA